jgi:hypothetical protein
VNNVRHEGPELTERVEVAEPALALELPVDSAPEQTPEQTPERTPEPVAERESEPTPNPR